jgi:hypothetical protein
MGYAPPLPAKDGLTGGVGLGLDVGEDKAVGIAGIIKTSLFIMPQRQAFFL